VFSSQKGGHLERQNLHPIIKVVAAAAGLSDKVSCHWLRHAHGSHAAERGVNPVLIKDTLVDRRFMLWLENILMGDFVVISKFNFVGLTNCLSLLMI
jgi:hypothetical protein